MKIEKSKMHVYFGEIFFKKKTGMGVDEPISTLYWFDEMTFLDGTINIRKRSDNVHVSISIK